MTFPWITFLTDYGLENKFTGVCRGSFAKIAPKAQVLDITHLVPRGDIRHGAAVLEQALPYLPAAVHMAVVDPGVGTDRRPVAVLAAGHILVGPDNGLLLPAADAVGGADAAFALTADWFCLTPMSTTFHGRDLFAPATAHLAAGVEPARLGPEIAVDSLVPPPPRELHVHSDRVDGEVLIVDRFGNAQTSITDVALKELGISTGDQLDIRTAGTEPVVAPFAETFGSVPIDGLLGHLDSANLLAIAVNCGNAAQRLRIAEGDRIVVRPAGRAG